MRKRGNGERDRKARRQAGTRSARMLSRGGRARGRNEEEKERDKVASEQAAQGRRGEERDDVTRDVKGISDVQTRREEDEKPEERGRRRGGKARQ